MLEYKILRYFKMLVIIYSLFQHLSYMFITSSSQEPFAKCQPFVHSVALSILKHINDNGQSAITTRPLSLFRNID